MKILNAKIYWNDNYSNSPDFQVLVDKIPNWKDLIYIKKKVDKSILYFAESDGFVDFYAYNGPDRGYGGRVFCLNTIQEDRSLKCEHITGPWSSRSGVMNKYFTQCVEVHMTDKEETFKKNGVYTAGALTIEKLKEALVFVQGASIIKISKYNEESYLVTKIGEPDTIEIIASRSNFK